MKAIKIEVDDLTNITLDERIQTQKLHIVGFYYYKIQMQAKINLCWQKAEEGDGKGSRAEFLGYETFYFLIWFVVTQLCTL